VPNFGVLWRSVATAIGIGCIRRFLGCRSACATSKKTGGLSAKRLAVSGCGLGGWSAPHPSQKSGYQRCAGLLILPYT
jgi:hypothetical protein